MDLALFLEPRGLPRRACVFDPLGVFGTGDDTVEIDFLFRIMGNPINNDHQ